MGLLSDDYFNSLEQKQAAPQAPSAPVAPVPTFGEKVAGQVLGGPLLAKPATKLVQSFNHGIATETNAPVKIMGDISPEKQVEKFGGEVGSSEYYNTIANKNPYVRYLPRQLGAAIGMRFPDDEVWDKMPLIDKAATSIKAGAYAAARLVTGLPKEVVKAPVRVAISIGQPWVRMAQGKDFSYDAIAKEKPVELPWLGQVPSYMQTYAEAKESGMGPLASTLMTVGTVAGDVSMTASLGEAAAGAFRPRAKLAPGENLQNVAPIKQAIVPIEGGGIKGVTQPAGSVSEYYTIPKSVAKDQFGGSTNNTFLKMTPAGADSIELSVVQVRTGAIPKTVDYIKNKFGVPDKTYQGDFGTEVKLQSKIIKTADEAGTAKPLTTLTDDEVSGILGNIPPKPLKGFEKAPINEEQLATLQKIGDYNGINPAVRDAVVRTVTGKSVVGELTQADYAKAAQTLGRFNNLSKYAPDAPGVNMASQYLAPQRYWMRTYEETSGIPLYSQVYAPMEDAIRLRDTFRDAYRAEARDIFGKYQGTAYGEERRLVSAYMRGEKGAILDNASLAPEVKVELAAIGDKMRGVYDKVGPLVDVPTDIFLKDYQPRVQNIGGIYQMYKEGSEIPKQLDFFAKFKRKGNLEGVQIDDALALFDIYTNSGSNRVFLNPVLERASALAETLPPNLHGSVRSYVLEKMGYAGKMEEFLDSFVPGINKKLGVNLPPDAARQFTNLGMSSLYSGLLSSPATWFRQTFQYPLFGYARLGPKYMGEAIAKGTSKAGMAEAQKAGFLVDLGVPYGEELAKDITLFGKTGNAYRKATQAVIKPNSMADNGMRSIVYHQAKMQWEDALAKYNGGKITWPQLEKELDFSAFSPVDQNLLRQKLVAGDMEGAFGNYAREILDETNFPYRKGASSRITYGLEGKLGTSLLQWPIEAASTLGRWVKTGQWDKLIRFYAASSAIDRTMKETFGFDFSKGLYLGPFNNFYSPFVKTGLDTINAFSSFMQNNKEDFNKNAESIVRTLKASTPAGVERQNIEKFFRSYTAGPDAEGKYPVLNDQKEVSYTTDFAGLFWGTLMGFPTENKIDSQNLSTDIRNAQFDRKQVKERVLELIQQEKYDEAGDLMTKTGVTVSASDMDDYYIPLNQRTFQSLPAILKAQFAPRVFPDAFTNTNQ